MLKIFACGAAITESPKALGGTDLGHGFGSKRLGGGHGLEFGRGARSIGGARIWGTDPDLGQGHGFWGTDPVLGQGHGFVSQGHGLGARIGGTD